MNNKRKSKVVDTFIEEEKEKCKIFWKFEYLSSRWLKNGSSEILADEKKILGVKVRRKSVISENEIFLESLKTPHNKFLPTPLVGIIARWIQTMWFVGLIKMKNNL